MALVTACPGEDLSLYPCVGFSMMLLLFHSALQGHLLLVLLVLQSHLALGLLVELVVAE